MLIFAASDRVIHLQNVELRKVAWKMEISGKALKSKQIWTYEVPGRRKQAQRGQKPVTRAAEEQEEMTKLNLGSKIGPLHGVKGTYCQHNLLLLILTLALATCIK